MTAGVKTHRDLEVWKRAISLTRSVYELTRRFPREEQYGLTSQMNRAAVSVPSNIAEGAARGSSREFRRFLLIARGSLSELETLAIVAKEVGTVPDAAAEELCKRIDHVSSLLEGLLKSLPVG